MTSTPDTPSGIEREIDQTQAHLASTVDELAARVAPKAIAQRGVASAQAKAREAVLDERGGLRTERVAAIGGSLVAVLTTMVTLSVRKRRRRRAERRAARSSERAHDRRS